MTGIYAASKAALNHLTKVVAAELGPMGIRVNSVAPGMTETEMIAPLREAMGEGFDAMITSQTPFRRLGEPADIARVVVMLASDEAGWVPGQTLDASGGFML